MGWSFDYGLLSGCMCVLLGKNIQYTGDSLSYEVMVQIRRKEPNSMNTLECTKVLSLILALLHVHFWLV